MLFTNASTSVSNLARQHSSLQLTPLVVASGLSGGLAEGLKNLQVFLPDQNQEKIKLE